jgi:hypothetical protein
LKGPYIAGRAYDAVMFIGAPLLALGIGALISGTPLADQEITLWGHEETATQIFIGAFIMAHLVLVGARSHLNAAIFARHRWRFVAAPLAVMGLLCASEWALAIAMVVVVWWDVVHSSMQTFGLGRIYDARRGNPPALGRRLDIGLNLVLYMGPLLGGVTLVEHLDSLGALDEAAGAAIFEVAPVYAAAHQGALAWAFGAIGLVYLIVYVLGYLRLRRRGYSVSPQKVALLATTGACSLYSWGFNSLGEAFFIMNFFHAWQYFGLVWWSERGNLRRRLRVERRAWGEAAALLLLLSVAGAYGLWAEVVDSEVRVALSATLVVSLMHFWYDGFIWSVRRRDV